MTPRSRWLLFLISTPLVLFVSIGGMLGATAAPPQGSFPHLRVFNDVYTRIVNYYVEPVNVEDVMDGAMRGLTDALDPLSSYLSREEVQAIESKAPVPAGDTGLVIVRQFWLRILDVRDGSPAARAGIRSGDFIRMIDGKATRDMSTFTGTRLLRGAPGTKVSLMVLRGTTVDPHIVDLIREPAPAALATSKRLPGGEGYVRVTSFATGAAGALKKEIDSLRGAGATSFVIDLRGIADGSPEEGLAAARHFVKTGTLATLVGREPERTPTTAAQGDGSITSPVVLLVSNGTANAAEVFAAALQGNHRADLVGEPTTGLAALQRLVKLPDNHGLWMTYAKYLGPDGNPIHERGLRPDVFVESPVVAFGDTPPTSDDQLTKATDRLKGKK